MRQQTRAFVIAATLGAISGCASKPLPDACYQPPESGQCRAAIERYYFDAGLNRCKAFIWGGCGGQVPFDTLEACTSTCGEIAYPASEEDSPHE